jgi:hypothetical protein
LKDILSTREAINFEPPEQGEIFLINQSGYAPLNALGSLQEPRRLVWSGFF